MDVHEAHDAVGPTCVDLFGGPMVRSGDAHSDPTLQQHLFLSLVFGHGPGGVARPRLGWLLWEQDDSPALRQKIRQLLHRTQERTGRPFVVTVGDMLRPSEEGVTCDLARFEALLERGSLEEAAGLLAHGFLSRIPSYPTRAFEDWAVAKSATLAEDLRRAASRRWDETSEAGLWADARDAAEALYMHHPSDPHVVAKVIEARARTGSIASAEAVLAACVDAAGATTRRDMEELLERVRRLRRSGPVRLSQSDPIAPLVGRTEEISRVRGILEDEEENQLRFVLITGEGGIGKTRVLDQIEREAFLLGWRCLHARASEAERHIPLNAIGDALETVDLAAHLRALGAPWRSVIASLLPVEDTEPLEEIPPIQEARLSRRLMDALFLLMRRVAGEEPTLLLIDDLHWADDTTLTALQFIQRRWEHGRLLIVAAARADLLDRSVPGREYLAPKEGLTITRVELHELSPEEGHRLVTHLMGAQIEPQIAERLCELAGLHPLYLTELTKDLAAGRLVLPELPIDEVAVPVSLQEIFQSRMRLLSSTAVKVAALLAARGKPMRLIDVASLTGLPIEHCADCAEELKEIRLVELERDTLRVAHELFRSALYRRLSEARRAVLHRAIAEHLSSGTEDVTPGELAIHFARAGERAPAARHAWIAATNAIEHGAAAEAAYFFELVVDNERDPRRIAEATAELARALHLNRAIGRANPLLELAAIRLRQIGNTSRALRMDIRRVEGLSEAGATPLSDLLGRLSAIKQEAEEGDDWEALALALDTELRLTYHAGALDRAQRLFADLRAIRGKGCETAAVVANYALCLAVLFGDAPTAVASADAAVRMTQARKHPYRLRVLNRAIIVRYHQGLLRRSDSDEIVSEARGLARTSGDLLERFSLESNLAAEAMDAGYVDQAEVLYLKADRLLGRAEMTFSRINHACNQGELALAMGDYRKARTCFLKADGFLGPTVPAYTSDFINAGVGLSAYELGDLPEARRRETQLKKVPTTYFYDPSTILRFRVRLMERRNEVDRAASILDAAANDLHGRLVLAWVKVRSLQARLFLDRDPGVAARFAQEALGVAEESHLQPKVAEIRSLLARIQRKGRR